MDLFHVWRKHKFAPFYIYQIPVKILYLFRMASGGIRYCSNIPSDKYVNQSTVTGEHTCMVLKPLNNEDVESSGLDQWVFFSPFYQGRFGGLLDSSFCAVEYKLAMSVLDPKINFTDLEPALPTISDRFLKSLDGILTPFDMKQLEAYINNLADYRMIWDLVPKLANPYFREKFLVTLSYAQASVLLCTGLQKQDISYVEGIKKIASIPRVRLWEEGETQLLEDCINFNKLAA
ncbi:hypothetical protein RHSIM_Rhsim07G0045000 [Rhododendron simsii]|uniref:Possible tRNA binding domain-containing protein n=1 Tax=Rhododendron simsii TaxID=118357 RepID=A0A834GNJ7_RHOSS|nr:hypothetical protein RHSIM_Rhsim07G0045000 [Rhododendron simsii]